MNLSQRQALIQAEYANDVNMAYKPSQAYASAAAMLAEQGYLERSITGGWWITSSGRRALALYRAMAAPVRKKA